MKKILITGGAGFVGRHFTKALLEMGYSVDCVDNIAKYTGGIDPRSGWPLFDPLDYKNFNFFKQDCREFFRNNTNNYDLVLHLAAIVGGRLVIENDPLAVAIDLSIDAQFWQWAKTNKPNKIICFSSSAAYPIALQTEKNFILLKEDHINLKNDIGMPDMSYGWSKLTHEYLGKLAHERYGLNVVAYRPFSGYGIDQDDTYPFPSICKRALKNKGSERLHVWGTGRQMRDFIHIDDCVEGVLKTMDKVNNGDAINLSTGLYTSFIQFAELAAKGCGYYPIVSGKTTKPSGVYARAGDTAKQKGLGFNHKIDLKRGINEALQYYDKII